MINNKLIREYKIEKNDYYEEIFPNIWIMDNQKWALYCWEQYKENNPIPSTLVHLDYHWDAINDFLENESDLKKMNLREIKETVKSNIIKYDSFLTPSIIRGYINSVYFHCFERNNEYGLDIDFLDRCNCIQNVYENIDDLILSVDSKKIILDLDLDIFNKTGKKGKLWTENEIKCYIDKITPLIKQAEIITIAMSFGYTGSDKEIEYLTKLIIPIIIQKRETEL